MLYLVLILSYLLNFSPLTADVAKKPQSSAVTVQLNGQFGNQLFQIATAYAYALDHDIPLFVPDLLENKQFGIPHNASRVFLSHISAFRPVSSVALVWREPSFNYAPIPPASRIHLQGYFQSEKYFLHRRPEILTLFAAPEDLQAQIVNKYPVLSSDQLTVGVQIRDYRREFPRENYHPTLKRNYYQKAFAYFPKETIFFVSSNNAKFARECTEGLAENIVYLEGFDYIEDFYTLVLCKSFIISNSTFGWWASWLSTAENKVVITPDPWWTPPYDNDAMKKDLLPEDYLVMEE